MQDVRVRLNPELSWQKHATRRRISSPADWT